MSKDLIVVPSNSGSELPVTQQDVETLKNQRGMLQEFVRSQLRRDVDYGIIEGTKKNSLFKPGAEKLARLFGLGFRVKLADKELDRKDNFAMYTYQAEVYLLKHDTVVISQCEGSCNSQEKKYRERSVIDKTVQPWAKVKEPTPVCDILNTLQKMAQKRAVVGAVILAVGASDFFSQDIDDPDDAAQVGITPEVKTVQSSIPKATSVRSDNYSDAPACPHCQKPFSVSRYPDKITGVHPWYCFACKVTKERSSA